MGTVPMERINVNFPKTLLDELRRYVPARQRSALIVRATEKELQRVKLVAVLDALSKEPAWTFEQHPDLSDGPAIDRALAESRATWTVIGQEPGND